MYLACNICLPEPPISSYTPKMSKSGCYLHCHICKIEDFRREAKNALKMSKRELPVIPDARAAVRQHAIALIEGLDVDSGIEPEIYDAFLAVVAGTSNSLDPNCLATYQ